MKLRCGNGYDVHALAPGLPLVLCGVKLPSEKGCVAHSDGDVAIHALCDAILGALAMGDIGKHFPDSDEKYRGIDSRLLLAEVCRMMQNAGWHICNVDITLVLQKPKVAGYIADMRKSLAELMQIEMDAVSVKATTTERLGFTGREEGIASYATVLLEKD
ncbi:MAG: 2-C-methyl-D-erythritol 2,4-cyclodiphosphate synthase [Bacteroidales bacterium]|nr:2-C-methyl-D-erythritol 2,4-cyclodiphosphate synthase [Bacteroidales bacterium]